MHANTTKRKLAFSVVFNLIITGVEIAGALLSGSLALLSDSFHNFNDATAIAISYIALKLGERERNEKYTFGYRRAEILAAFINSVILLSAAIFLIYEAYERLLHPAPIKGMVMLTVAFVGLFANLIVAILLHSPSKESMNIKAAYLHIIGDTISSVAVIIGGFAILLWDVIWVDPLITILISLYLIYSAFKILKDSVEILMEAAPPIDIQKVKREIESIEGVINAHHFHIWRIGEGDVLLECHVDVEDMPVSQAQGIIDEISSRLRKYGITHVTVQIECRRCRRKDVIP